MPFPAPQKPIPIATLIKWFIERKKGKIVEARREIQHRFLYLDWKDQKKIIIGFLDSCESDRKWIYKRLYHHWDDSIFPYLIETLKKYPDEIYFLSGVIPYVPLSFIKEHYYELSVGRGYYYICRRYVHDKVTFALEESRLYPHEFLHLLKEMEASIDEEKAMDILFRILHKYATGYRFAIEDVQNYIEVNPRHIISRGMPFTAMDFRYIYILCQQIENLGGRKILHTFEEWDRELADTIVNSPEFKHLNEVSLPDDEYDEKRRMIAKRYIYKLMPNKYKSSDDNQPYADNDYLLSKLRKEHPQIDTLIDKLGLQMMDDVPF